MPFYGVAVMGNKIALFIVSGEEIIKVVKNL
jgi:hypothetical protein